MLLDLLLVFIACGVSLQVYKTYVIVTTRKNLSDIKEKRYKLQEKPVKRNVFFTLFTLGFLSLKLNTPKKKYIFMW